MEIIPEIGELLITKIRRVVDENEPLEDTAPLIYTPKQEGVIPQYDIRSSKWDIAMQAMDRVNEYKASQYLKVTDGGELIEKGDDVKETTENPKTNPEIN